MEKKFVFRPGNYYRVEVKIGVNMSGKTTI